MVNTVLDMAPMPEAVATDASPFSMAVILVSKADTVGLPVLV